MGIQPHRQITQTLSLVREDGHSSLHTVQFYLRDSRTGTLCGQEWAETDREGKPGDFWEWRKCSISCVYTIQNCRTVHLKWVCFIVGKLYLNKVNFKKQETEYEQRRRATVFSLKYLFFIPLPLRLPRPSVYKLGQNITQNMMGKFAIKYINAFKNYALISSCMLDAMIITKNNLVNECPNSCSLLGVLADPWKPIDESERGEWKSWPKAQHSEN